MSDVKCNDMVGIETQRLNTPTTPEPGKYMALKRQNDDAREQRLIKQSGLK